MGENRDTSPADGGIGSPEPPTDGRRQFAVTRALRRLRGSPAFVSVDRKGRAAATPAQTSRHAAHASSARRLAGNAGNPWIGIVTDGAIWHSWRYAHERNPQIETDPTTPTSNAAALMEALATAFGRDRTGKPWVPAVPADLFRDHEAALADLFRQLPPAFRTRTETKQQLWLDMLRVSGITPGDPDALFVTHSLLIAIARLAAHGLTRRTSDWLSALDDGFVSWITDSELGRASGRAGCTTPSRNTTGNAGATTSCNPST